MVEELGKSIDFELALVQLALMGLRVCNHKQSREGGHMESLDKICLSLANLAKEELVLELLGEGFEDGCGGLSLCE